LPATFFIAFVWALPPTRLTEMPNVHRRRTPRRRGRVEVDLASVIEMTLVGM